MRPIDRGWPAPGIKNMFVLKKVLYYKFYTYPSKDKLVKNEVFQIIFKIISRWIPGGNIFYFFHYIFPIIEVIYYV
jgi:hypothetical protein